MLFYASKCVNRLNGQPWRPEHITGRVMLNPSYRIHLTEPAQTICDSSAFQDVKGGRRQPWEALDRQLAYERYIQCDEAIPLSWHFEALVTYDQMLGVDEQIVNGTKVKRRGTEETARPAIAETLRCAAYYATQRHRVQGTLCFAAQGATPRQYVEECVLPLLDLMRPGDWFAFGGFCIIGPTPSLKPLFVETLRAVMPLLARASITRAHLLGVAVQDMVCVAETEGRKHGVVMSLDTSAIEVRSVMGAVFDGTRWAKTYTKAQKGVDYHPAELAARNLRAYDQWCARL